MRVKEPTYAQVKLTYKNVIPHPTMDLIQLMNRSSAADPGTIEHWRTTWVSQMKANDARYGFLGENTAGVLFNKHQGGVAICAGSGPSLKRNAHLLKDRPKHVTLLSCLHNFHFMEDQGIPVDYYVTVDAGPVTIEEVSEGGSKPPEAYWEATHGKTLLAFAGTHPELLAKWRGRVLFFDAPVGDKAIRECLPVERRPLPWITAGGTVLGAAFSLAKCVLGTAVQAFVGADFAFGYDHKFHPWDSKYDASMGNVEWWYDIYGIRVPVWPSYFGMKCWFDHKFCVVPGIYFNCTEGGILGSYPEGNIAQVRAMDLDEFLWMTNLSKFLAPQCLEAKYDETIVF